MFLAMILLALIGLLSAVLDSLVDIDGGVIIVPTLVYLGVSHHLLHGIATQVAVGASLVILIVTGLSSSIDYLKTRQVDIKSGSIFLFGLLPSSLIGSFLSRYLILNSFNLYSGILMICVSILLMIRHKIKPFRIFDKEKYRKTYIDAKGMIYHCSVPPIFAFSATLFIGILTGLSGTGDGALITPLMFIVFRLPPHVTVGTSMMMIFFSSIMGPIGHIIQNRVAWSYLVILVISSYIGARVRVKINHSTKSETIVLLLRTIMLVMDVYLIIKSFL